MNDNWTITERAAVLREREAFARGAQWAWVNNYAQCAGAKFNHDGYVDGRAADHYPLPTITRPRVVKDPHKANTSWRCKDGLLWYSWTNKENQGWYTGTVLWNPTPERVKLWADLLANPTEEVTE